MSQVITLAHGSGGLLTHQLIEQVILKHLNNPILNQLGDAAILDGGADRLAFTTDSYVISPLFFPGGDIGKLAVCGTVNDLAVSGAEPRWLCAGLIVEEGLSLETLERVIVSMGETARAAGVQIVAGDTKVVGRGAADRLFIHTSGIGVVRSGCSFSLHMLRPGDVILVSGTVGDHGMAVLMQREGLSFDSMLQSDCAPLNGLIGDLLAACPGEIRCMRDPTRGGLVSTLNEWASAAGLGIEVVEAQIPLQEPVRAACEFLGLDPLYVANEGKVVVAVAAQYADVVLNTLRQHPLGQNAALIGQVTDEHAGRVVLRTAWGTRRVLNWMAGEQLPRIC